MEQIFELIITKEDLEQYLHALTAIDLAFYSVSNQIEQKLTEDIDYNKRDRIIAYFTKNNLDIKNQAHFHAFVEETSHAAKSIPFLQLSFSFLPNRAQIETIAQWLSVNADKKYLLDVHIQREIIGGLMIGANGKYKDYSVKKILDDYLAGKIMNQN